MKDTKEAIKYIEKDIFLNAAIYGVICAIISAFAIGINAKFFIGLAAGLAAMAVNFRLLEILICTYFGKYLGFEGIEEKRTGRLLPAAIYIVRLCIYAAGIFICYKMGVMCVIAFAVGVMGLPVAALLHYLKGKIL